MVSEKFKKDLVQRQFVNVMWCDVRVLDFHFMRHIPCLLLQLLSTVMPIAPRNVCNDSMHAMHVQLAKTYLCALQVTNIKVTLKYSFFGLSLHSAVLQSMAYLSQFDGNTVLSRLGRIVRLQSAIHATAHNQHHWNWHYWISGICFILNYTENNTKGLKDQQQQEKVLSFTIDHRLPSA